MRGTRWSRERELVIGISRISDTEFLIDLRHCSLPLAHSGRKNRGDDVARHTFEFCIKLFPSRAVLVDGSTRVIERDTIVKWEVELADIDPQELESMEEEAVRNVVDKIGESVVWGPEQEVSLL